MSKRFTDTDKWRDPWFASLGEQDKLFWIFLLDNCSFAGIWQVHWPLVKFYIPNFEFKDENFKDRIQKISDDKWFVPKFIKYQYGRLQKASRVHKRIIDELKKQGVSKQFTHPRPTLGLPLAHSGPRVKDKDKVKEKDKDVLSSSLKEGLGEKFRVPSLVELRDYCAQRGNLIDPEAFYSFYESNGWRVGRNPMRSWKAAMITWEKNKKQGGIRNGHKGDDATSIRAIGRKEDAGREFAEIVKTVQTG